MGQIWKKFPGHEPREDERLATGLRVLRRLEQVRILDLLVELEGQTMIDDPGTKELEALDAGVSQLLAGNGCGFRDEDDLLKAVDRGLLL